MTNLKTLILTDPTYTAAALIRLYSYTNKKITGMGFTKTDNLILGKIASQLVITGKLKQNQLRAAKRLLPKYHDQLENLEPISVIIEDGEPIRIREQEESERVVKLLAGKLIIKFPRDKYDVLRIKTLSNRKYDKKLDQWSCPVNLRSVMLLIQWGFDLDTNAKAWYSNNRITLQDLLTKKVDIPDGDMKKIIRQNKLKLPPQGDYGMEPIKPSRKNGCADCAYVDRGSCGVCGEHLSADIFGKGCMNWKENKRLFF